MRKEVIDNILETLRDEKKYTKNRDFWLGLERAEVVVMHKAGILDLRPKHLKQPPNPNPAK